jgi:hypothetical protein
MAATRTAVKDVPMADDRPLTRTFQPDDRMLASASPRVELPDGRHRSLLILDVTPSSIGAQMAVLERDAEAA